MPSISRTVRKHVGISLKQRCVYVCLTSFVVAVYIILRSMSIIMCVRSTLMMPWYNVI